MLKSGLASNPKQHQCTDPGEPQTRVPLSVWQGLFLLFPSPSLLCSHYQLTPFSFQLQFTVQREGIWWVQLISEVSVRAEIFAEPVTWLCSGQVSASCPNCQGEEEKRLRRTSMMTHWKEVHKGAVSVASSLRIYPFGPQDLSICVALASNFLNHIVYFRICIHYSEIVCYGLCSDNAQTSSCGAISIDWAHHLMFNIQTRWVCFLEPVSFSLRCSAELPVEGSIKGPYLPKERAGTSSHFKVLFHRKNPGLDSDLWTWRIQASEAGSMCKINGLRR